VPDGGFAALVVVDCFAGGASPFGVLDLPKKFMKNDIVFS